VKEINQDEMCSQIGARPKLGWCKRGEVDEIPKKSDGCSVMQSAYISDDGLLFVDEKGLERVNERQRARGAPPLDTTSTVTGEDFVPSRLAKGKTRRDTTTATSSRIDHVEMVRLFFVTDCVFIY
jgi:hypothetical protein